MNEFSLIESRIAEIGWKGLAALAGYTRQHVTGVIRGERDFSSSSLEAIANALGVSQATLIEYRRAQVNGSCLTDLSGAPAAATLPKHQHQ